MFNLEGVRYCPEPKVNTGLSKSNKFSWICKAKSFLSVFTGQQLVSGKGNTSMNSPLHLLVLVDGMYIKISLLSKNFKCFHRRVELQSKIDTLDDKISPILTEVKKPTEHAVQITCFEISDQFVREILWPINSRVESVIVLLHICDSFSSSFLFLTPFKINFNSLSEL
jgi:hypothetical protein